jgi:hypothetical protein
MNTILIIFGAVVIFCIGFLLGMDLGKMDRVIINMKR